MTEPWRPRRASAGAAASLAVVGADVTPEPAPLPAEPAPPSGDDRATVTLEDVQANEELSRFIASADRVMDAMGFTEHGFRHANLVARISYQVLSRLGYGERDATLACVAGYLHDVGNALARDAHGQTGRDPRAPSPARHRRARRPDADHRRDREPRGEPKAPRSRRSRPR